MGRMVLGPMVFDGFEIPQRVRFGGRQRLAVHGLPGGGRVVDAMGADEGSIDWSGVFAGPRAAERARQVERLRREGAPLPLSWDGWRYTVVIETLQAETANPAWIPYALRACVVAEGDVPVIATAAAFIAAIFVGIEGVDAGAGIDGRIDAAGAAVGSENVEGAMNAAGALARMVAARALSWAGA